MTATETPVAEPVALKVTRYRCPFCPRSRSSKAAIRPHIARCWHNPAAHACGTCRHMERDDYEDDFGCAAGLDPYIAETDTVTHPDDFWMEDVPGPRQTVTRYHLVRNCPGWEPAP